MQSVLPSGGSQVKGSGRLSRRRPMLLNWLCLFFLIRGARFQLSERNTFFIPIFKITTHSTWYKGIILHFSSILILLWFHIFLKVLKSSFINRPNYLKIKLYDNCRALKQRAECWQWLLIRYCILASCFERRTEMFSPHRKGNYAKAGCVNLTVANISQMYMCIKSTHCAPSIYIILFVSYLSTKLGKI